MDMDLIDLHPDNIADELAAAASKMKEYAHKPEHHNVFHLRRIKRSRDAPGTVQVVPVEALGPDHKHRIKLPSRETTLFFTYAIDDLPDLAGAAELATADAVDEMSNAELKLWERGLRRVQVRHLCVQISVPGHVTQGIVNVGKLDFLEFFSPMVKVFFPLHESLKATLMAHQPVPIVDQRASKGDDVVAFRTPISAHFVVDVNDVESLNAG